MKLRHARARTYTKWNWQSRVVLLISTARQLHTGLWRAVELWRCGVEPMRCHQVESVLGLRQRPVDRPRRGRKRPGSRCEGHLRGLSSPRRRASHPVAEGFSPTASPIYRINFSKTITPRLLARRPPAWPVEPAPAGFAEASPRLQSPGGRR